MPSTPRVACTGTSPDCEGSYAQGRGACAPCSRKVEQRQGSAHARGYTSRWRRFRETFRNRLIAQGIAPLCGASLPIGPRMTASRCQAEGRETSERLHLHHDPPLRDDERSDPRAVCNLRRVGLLCEQCHGVETSTHGNSAPHVTSEGVGASERTRRVDSARNRRTR